MSTNILSLDRAIQNTILWINDIQEELHWDSRDMVYKATKAVLQAIRDRLPIEELAHFSANLPMIMKGMLMDGYDPRDKPLKMKTIEEFYDCIQDYYDAQRRAVINPEDAARGVINTLALRMGGGEMQKVADNMPERIKPLFERAAQETRKPGRERAAKREIEVSQP